MALTPDMQRTHLIDDLEGAFQNSISLLTSQEHFNVQETDETKTSVENAMLKFMDVSRQVEAFFLQKKMALAYQKPEQLINDDIAELRAELARKDQLLEKHVEKLKRCKMILQSGSGAGAQPQTHQQGQAAQSSSTQQQQQQPQPQPPPPPVSLPQYTPHPPLQTQMSASQVGGPGGMGGNFPTGPGQGFAGRRPPSPVQNLPHGMPRPQPPSYPQGPLAYLEQTTSNIGMPDRR